MSAYARASVRHLLMCATWCHRWQVRIGGGRKAEEADATLPPPPPTPPHPALWGSDEEEEPDVEMTPMLTPAAPIL